MNKYIIKNCPAYCYLGKECHNEESKYGISCCEVTDCIMKRIVDECRRGINNSQCNCGAIGNLVNILNQLDIQEVDK